MIWEKVKSGALIALIGAVAILLATRPAVKPQIPTIITKHDTVSVVQFKRDTAWFSKIIKDTVHDTVNLTQREVVPAKPDTVRVFYPVSGILGFLAGRNYGRDTTKLLMFTMTPVDSANSFSIQSKLYEYYTPGPVGAVAMNSEGSPVVRFYDAPKECRESRSFLTGALTGVGVTLGARLILGRP